MQRLQLRQRMQCEVMRHFRIEREQGGAGEGVEHGQ